MTSQETQCQMNRVFITNRLLSMYTFFFCKYVRTHFHNLTLISSHSAVWYRFAYVQFVSRTIAATATALRRAIVHWFAFYRCVIVHHIRSHCTWFGCFIQFSFYEKHTQKKKQPNIVFIQSINRVKVSEIHGWRKKNWMPKCAYGLT